MEIFHDLGWFFAARIRLTKMKRIRIRKDEKYHKIDPSTTLALIGQLPPFPRKLELSSRGMLAPQGGGKQIRRYPKLVKVKSAPPPIFKKN